MKFVLNIIRKFFSWLDVVVYKCVAIIFQLIVDLANVQIFTDSTINEFANRMYIILGLIMLFKIMISFIQILINPDAISDKEKGAGNILKRVTISLALIALVPSIFKFAREVQGYIVPVIPRVILGINDRATTTRYDENGNEITSESDVDVVNESNIGDTVAWQSFLPFFNYNEGCEDGSLKLNSGYSDELLSVFSVGSASEHVNDTCSESQVENSYKYDYTFLISTAVGVYLLFILIQVAVAIAVRAIKFGICEFVAPIPIASYVDPKTSKSTFDKWVSTSVKVYLDLFMRLIIVYFVVYIMIVIFGDASSITKIYENVGKDWFRTTLVILFLIIGLFKFVKEAPKFISDLLGLKTDGDIGNMFKNAWDSTNLATVGARGAIDSIKASSEAGENKSLTALRAAKGFLGATGATLRSNLFNGKSMKEGANTALSSTHSNTKRSIAGSRAFARDGRVGIVSMMDFNSQQRIDNRRARAGLSSVKAGLDNSIGSLQSITNGVETALKDTGGNKVAKYWANRYEAAKNMGIEVFEEELMAPDKQVISNLEKEIEEQQTKLNSTTRLYEKQAITDRINNLKTQLNDKVRDLDSRRGAIRIEAQKRQATYVNQADKDLSDAKTRLLRFAVSGDASVLTDEDIQGSGLGSAEKIYEDGGILGRVKQNMNSIAAGINDKKRDDERLEQFSQEEAALFRGSDGTLDFSKLSGSEIKALRDAANTSATTIKNSQEYYQAQFTEQNANNGK